MRIPAPTPESFGAKIITIAYRGHRSAIVDYSTADFSKVPLYVQNGPAINLMYGLFLAGACILGWPEKEDVV